MVDLRDPAQSAYWNYIGAKRRLDTLTPGTHNYKSWEDEVNIAYSKAKRNGITEQQMMEITIKHKKQFGY